MKIAYVDSAVWIAQCEGKEAYQQIVDEKIASLENDEWMLAFSDLVFLEVLLKPHRQERLDLIEVYDNAFAQALWLPASESVFRDAFDIAHADNLKTVDAIHIAIAVKHKCELFVTTDPDFRNLQSLPLQWIDLSQALPK
ncbi:MAG: PIN domain-containing protein [Candidatus Omnitrophota bacterium]